MAINADALEILLNLNGADLATTITDSSENGSTITNNQGSYGYNSTDTSKFGSASGKFLNTRLSHTAVDVVYDTGTLTTSDIIVYNITLPVGTIIYNSTRNAYAIVYDYGQNTVDISGTPTDIDYFLITPPITGQDAGDIIYYGGSDIQIPNTNISFNEDFSISFWIQAGTGAGVILDTRSSLDDANNFYVTLEDDDTIKVKYNSDSTKGSVGGKAGTTILETTTAISTTVFDYVEIGRKNGVFGIYINETIESYTFNNTWYNFDSNSAIQLGNVVGAVGAGFNGYIDELQIWDGMSKNNYVGDILTLESSEYSTDIVDIEVSNIVLQTEIHETNLEVSNIVMQTEIQETNLVISNIVLQVEIDPDTVIVTSEACSIQINGVDYTTQSHMPSVKIITQDNFSNSASLKIVTNSNAVKMGMELIISKGSEILFGGLIQQPKRTLLSPDFMVLDIYSEGYKQILGRRTFSVDAQNQFAGDIVSDLFNSFIIVGSSTSEEITLGNIDNGVQVENYVKSAETGMKIYNDMADASGFKWWITNEKAFYFQATPTYTDNTLTKKLTPNKLDSAYINAINMPDYDEDSSKFRTRQFVIGKTLDNQVIVGNYVDTVAETEMATRYGSGVFGAILTNQNINNSTDADAMAQTEVETYVNPASISFSTFDKFNVLELITVDIPLLDISAETYKTTKVTKTIDANCRVRYDVLCEKYVIDTKQKRVWTDEFNEMLKNNADTEGRNEFFYDEIGVGGTIVTAVAPDTRTITTRVDIDKALHTHFSIVGTTAGAGTVTITVAIDTVTKKTYVFDVVAGNFSKTFAYPIRTITTSGSSTITAITTTTVNLNINQYDLTFWVSTS